MRIERVTREQGLYISPATLQSFKSMLCAALLNTHIHSTAYALCASDHFPIMRELHVRAAEQDLQGHADEIQARVARLLEADR